MVSVFSLINQKIPVIMFNNFLCRFVIVMVYYAMAMNTGSMGGNRYVSFSLSGLVDVPSFIIAYFILDKCVQFVLQARLYTLLGFDIIIPGGKKVDAWRIFISWRHQLSYLDSTSE